MGNYAERTKILENLCFQVHVKLNLVEGPQTGGARRVSCLAGSGGARRVSRSRGEGMTRCEDSR